MKTKQSVFFLCIICSVLFLQAAYAWELEIHADREATHDYVIIGVNQEGEYLACPPNPPDFYCRICIEGTEENFMKLIHKETDNNEYEWPIQVNPHGNLGPPVALTSILSWDLSSAPTQYTFQLIDKDNNIVINDMSKQDSYDVSGLNTFYSYKITANPYQSPDLKYDLNEDGVVNIGDVIFLLKILTGF